MNTLKEIVQKYRDLRREQRELGKIAVKEFCPFKIGQDLVIPKEALRHVGKTGRICSITFGVHWRVPGSRGAQGDRCGWNIQVLVHNSDGTVGHKESEWWIAL